MDSTKGASLIPEIGCVKINNILLLYFICFLAGVLLFLLSRNPYVFFYLFVFFVSYSRFCNLFKAFSLPVIFIPSNDIFY